MNAEENFKEFYRTSLIPFLKEFDKKRLPLVWLRLANWLLLIIMIAGIFLIANIFYNSAFYITLLPFLGLFIYFIIKRKKLKQVYRDEYKNNVIKKIVHLIDSDLNYDYTGRISDSEFYKSKIYTTSADRSSGEDLVSGKMGKTDIKFSEIHLEYKTTSTDSEGRTTTTWHTIFKGVFFIADFNKHFKTETFVLPDGLERLLGKFARKIQKVGARSGKLIELEDPEFEKHFRVYAEDGIESRYLLSPALMQRLTEFRKKSGIRFSLSFVDSKIYLALPITKDLFEPRIFKTNVNYEFIKESFSYLLLFTGIVEELNLNTRIWTKK